MQSIEHFRWSDVGSNTFSNKVRFVMMSKLRWIIGCSSFNLSFIVRFITKKQWVICYRPIWVIRSARKKSTAFPLYNIKVYLRKLEKHGRIKLYQIIHYWSRKWHNPRCHVSAARCNENSTPNHVECETSVSRIFLPFSELVCGHEWTIAEINNSYIYFSAHYRLSQPIS